MSFKEVEKSRWNSLIENAMADNDYSEQVEEDCELLLGWLRTLTEESRLTVVMDHVLRGLRLPWFYQDDPSFTHIFRDLAPLYVSPLRFTIGGDDGKVLSLSFKQFSALHTIYSSTQTRFPAPMIRAQPEYWYFYLACMTTHDELGEQCPEPKDAMTVGGVPAPHGKIEVVVSSETLAIQDAARWIAGLAVAPRFHIPNDSYRMTMSLYAAWPSYWDRILELPVLSFIGKKTCEAVRYVKAVNGEINNRVFVNARQDAYIALQMRGESIYEYVTAKVPVPVPYLTIMSPIAFDNTARPLEATPCSCHRCGSLTIDSVLPVIGERNFVEAMTEVPIILTDIPANLIGKNGMTSTDVDAGSEKLGIAAAASFWHVAVNKHLWNSYLTLDALLAKYANNQIYDRVIEEPVLINIDLANTYFKNLGGGRPPKTFYKFAWIYWALGMVPLDVCGKYPVGRPKPLKLLRALEISGAPWGNMMALIEAGLVSLMAYTCYTGEAFNLPVYNTVDKFGNKLVYNLLEGYEGPTDIKSLTRAIHAEATNKKPMLSKVKFDHIVLDIPLHRNSSSAHSGRDYSKENRDRKLKEFVDDLPLGKKQAMRELIGYYKIVIERLLERGGTLIIKVLEFWHKDIIEALWVLFNAFSVVKVFRNPYSRVVSKEVYFVGLDYESGTPISKTIFLGACIKMANHVLSNLTVNIVRLAQRHGMECITSRQICCRKDLYDMPCFPFTGTHNEYHVPKAPKKPQHVALYFAYERIKIDPLHVENLKGLGYLTEEAMTLLTYWGNERMVLAAPDDAKKALLKIKAGGTLDDKWHDGTWRVDSDTAKLIAKLTGVSFQRALDALAISKGDLVVAISNINMGA